MQKAGGIVALIARIFGTLVAIVTLLFGGLGAAVSAEGANTSSVRAGAAFCFRLRPSSWAQSRWVPKAAYQAYS